MQIEINGWLNASQDTGNPNVDGTDVNIVCSANTGNARSDYFEIMAGVLENGEIVDELRERVSVNQELGIIESKLKFHLRMFHNDVNIQFLQNVANISNFYLYYGSGSTDYVQISPTKEEDVQVINELWTYDMTDTILSDLFKNTDQIRITFRLILNGTYIQSYDQARGILSGTVYTNSNQYDVNEMVQVNSGNQSSYIDCEVTMSWYPEDDNQVEGDLYWNINLI